MTAAGVLPRADMNRAFWEDVARIKAGPNPSFANCFALALARRLKATLLTTDRHEFDNAAVRALCDLEFLR